MSAQDRRTKDGRNVFAEPEVFIVVQNHKALLGNARIRCERVRDFRIAAPNVIGLRTRRTADDAFEAKSAIETLQALQRAAV
ncbi:MAG TPA: hypothetical protein VIO32_04675, partial [Candidatus Baltobacteraceae bacterium]